MTALRSDGSEHTSPSRSRPRSIAHDHALRLARVLGHGRALEQHGQAVVVLELVDLRKQLEIHVGGVVVPMS